MLNCGSKEYQESIVRASPHLENQIHALEWLVKHKQASNVDPALRSSVWTIPVVVHVLHDNGPENIGNAQVQSAISQLNAAFDNAGSYSNPLGNSIGIQFCLAQQDPQGNPSAGINSVQTPLTVFTRESQDAQLKAISHWPGNQYLNIWVVREVLSSTEGAGIRSYATMPFLHGRPLDGIVIEHDYFGTSANATKVLVHEAGHYLGLYHTFEGGCQNTDCSLQGDRVCDTPPDASTASSLAPFNSCHTDSDDPSPSNPFRPQALGGLGDQMDQIDNYMDFGRLDVLARFTYGQRLRMRAHLQNARQSLLDGDRCDSPCTTPVSSNFQPSNSVVTIGDSISFLNQSLGATQFEWYVDGQLFSNAANPALQFSQAGFFEIMLRAGAGQAACFAESKQIVEVQCDAEAAFSTSALSILAGGRVDFISNAQNASQVLWLLDGQGAGGTASFSQTFNQPSIHTVQLLAFSASCTDSSALAYISVGSCEVPSHTANWIFGDSAGLGFQSTAPTLTGASGISSYEGCASFSDENGTLLLYSDGNTVWNRNHLPVGNGQGLMGNKSSSQGVIILPLPGSSTKYYVFTTDAIETGFFAGLRYSIVDMGLLNGAGAISPSDKNIFLAPMNSEMITAVQHENGEDYWLLTHQAFSSNFRCYLLTSNGINPVPVISSLGPLLDLPTGYIKVSPDRRKLALSYNQQSARSLGIADFDPATGQVSNLYNVPVGPTQQVYGVEFSEDGSKAYFSTFFELYQVDLSLGSQAAVVNSLTNIHSVSSLQLMGLQRGLDGKVYVAGGLFDMVHSIESPNLPGAACGFQWASISLNGKKAMWGLPNFYNGIPRGLEKVEIEGSDVVCESEDLYWFRARKESMGDQLGWSALAGSIAQTSGDTLAGIRFSQPGAAQVLVERDAGCGVSRDTLNVSVRSAPISDLAPDTALCAGSSLALVASTDPAVDVLWSTGSTASGIVLAAPARASVRLKNADGCIRLDSISLDSLSLLPINLDLGQDTAICEGRVLLLSAEPGPNRSYLWQDGSQGVFYTATQAGVYSVQVSDACGGFAVDSLQVMRTNSTLLNLGPDRVVCPGDTVVLTPGADFAYWEWQDGSSTPVFNATQSGFYHLTATTYGGCVVRDTVELLPCLVGIESEGLSSTLSIYPVPNNGAFSVRMEGLPALGDVQLRILNGLGQALYSGISSAEALRSGIKLDLRGLPGGFYFVELAAGDLRWQKKLEIVPD